MVEDLEWKAGNFCRVECEDGFKVDVELLQERRLTMPSVNDEN